MAFGAETHTLRREARNLPIWKVRENLIKCVRDHDTVIFVGETGSGKTTQIPQVRYYFFARSMDLYIQGFLYCILVFAEWKR